MRARTRRTLTAVGAAALVTGVALVRGAGSGAPTGLTALLQAGGAALAAFAGYAAYRSWFPEGTADPPAVERTTEHPRPGDAFDRTLAQFDGTGGGYLPDRKAIHDRLRAVAAEVFQRRGGDVGADFEPDRGSESAPATAVEAGDWPGDPVVASFLDDPDVRLPRATIDRVRALLGRLDEPSDFQRNVRRTVDDVAARSGLLGVDDGPPPGETGHGGDDGTDRRTASDLRQRVGAGAEPATTRTDGAVATDGAGGPLESVATGRWRVAVPVALAFVGFGFAFRRAAVVLSGVVAVGVAAYARTAATPSPTLTVERTTDADRPDPGEVVEVTVTVRNDGDRTVPDLRIVDGVPAGLPVVEGSPRLGTTLRPGESTAFGYTLRVRRGVHEFDPAYAVVRGYAGATARVRLVGAVDGADPSITCVPRLIGLPVPVPLFEQSGDYLGRIPAAGGEGVEFHATREYRPGDPTNRIDWNRLARSPEDELTTVEFREERAATVALVVDALPAAYLAASPDDPSAVEHALEAAGRLFGSLLDSGDRVGVAALGPTPAWLAPDVGPDHRKRVEELLAADPAFPPTAPDADELPSYWVREFHGRFPGRTQVVLFTPLCDRRYRFVIRRLRAYGHPVTVLSPDVTVDGTVGQRLVRLERRLRIETLRETGVRVIDWDPDEELAAALGRAATRWVA